MRDQRRSRGEKGRILSGLPRTPGYPFARPFPRLLRFPSGYPRARRPRSRERKSVGRSPREVTVQSRHCEPSSVETSGARRAFPELGGTREQPRGLKQKRGSRIKGAGHVLVPISEYTVDLGSLWRFPVAICELNLVSPPPTPTSPPFQFPVSPGRRSDLSEVTPLFINREAVEINLVISYLTLRACRGKMVYARCTAQTRWCAALEWGKTDPCSPASNLRKQSPSPP